MTDNMIYSLSILFNVYFCGGPFLWRRHVPSVPSPKSSTGDNHDIYRTIDHDRSAAVFCRLTRAADNLQPFAAMKLAIPVSLPYPLQMISPSEIDLQLLARTVGSGNCTLRRRWEILQVALCIRQWDHPKLTCAG